MQIETDRLFLRAFRDSDFRDAKAVWGDKETMSFYPQPYTDEKIKIIISEQIRAVETTRHGLLAVVRKSDGAFLGDCGITIQNIDGVEEYEIGYHINKAYWGFGYAAEAAQGVKQYGFSVLQLTKLCSYMESAHKQSRRVAEKIGMTLEKEYLNPNNRNLPTVVYSAQAPASRAQIGQ